MRRRRASRRRSGLRIALDWLLTIAGLSFLAFAVVWLDGLNPHVLVGDVRVVDGDSLVMNGEKVRLKGIDAPEFKQLCQRDSKDWECGRRSRDALRSLVRGKTVECKVGSLDKYDRWLGVCTADGRNLNLMLVEKGWAVDYGGYSRAELRARDARRGIWAGRFERPQEWRRARQGDATSTSGIAAAMETISGYFRGIVIKYFG